MSVDKFVEQINDHIKTYEIENEVNTSDYDHIEASKKLTSLNLIPFSLDEMEEDIMDLFLDRCNKSTGPVMVLTNKYLRVGVVYDPTKEYSGMLIITQDLLSNKVSREYFYEFLEEEESTFSFSDWIEHHWSTACQYLATIDTNSSDEWEEEIDDIEAVAVQDVPSRFEEVVVDTEVREYRRK